MLKVVIGDFNHELSSGHEFRDVITYIESVYATRCKEIGTDYPKGHVFDEENSVKWNREKVESENARKSSERDAARLLRMQMRDRLYDYIKLYVEAELNIKVLDMSLIDNLVTYLKDHFDYEWPNHLDETLELIKSFS